MEKAYVWKENAERIKSLYDSDFYHHLKATNPQYVRSICNALMEDPDTCDKKLYVEKAKELSNMNLKCKGTSCMDGDATLGMDCVIGWKKMFDVHNGEIEWIDDYCMIRSKLSAHMLWPRAGNNTINTVRARVFNDRIDYTLYDLKRFYAKDNSRDECKMKVAYENPTTNKWLLKFGSFEEFARRMNLLCWLNEDFDVIDMSNTSKTISNYGNDPRTIDDTYLNNLKDILKGMK